MRHYLSIIILLCTATTSSWSNVSPRIHGMVIQIDKIEGAKVSVSISNHGGQVAVLNDLKLGGINFEIRIRSSLWSYNTSFRGSIGSNMPKLLRIPPGKTQKLEFDLKNWCFPEEVPESLQGCDLRVWYSAQGWSHVDDAVWLGPFVSD